MGLRLQWVRGAEVAKRGIFAPVRHPFHLMQGASLIPASVRPLNTTIRDDQGDLQTLVGRMGAKKTEWATLPASDKAKLLGEMLEIFSTIDHEAWAREALRAQGYDKVQPDTLVATEMIMNTKIISADLENLIDVFATLRDTGAPPVVPIREGVGGRSVASVYPRLMADSRGPTADWRAEVWLQGDGATRGQQAPPGSGGRLGVLLAAGNQGMLSFCDALYLLFVENMACVVKHNPVRAYNHRWMEALFAPLVRAGYFASVVGGVDESQALVYDDRVDHVHMTGGKATHDAIVWGGGQRDRNLLGKPITSELGAVTPYVIGPGDWSETELSHHARYFATVLANNNGCNCNAPQVLVLPAGKFPTAKFLETVKGVLRSRPHAPPYYPGTASRHQAWVDGLGRLDGATTELISSDVKLPPEHFGPPLPWALTELDHDALSGDRAEIATRIEAFGPTLAIVTLPTGEVGADPASFWTRAASFCNDRLEGTLSCTLIAHPSHDLSETDVAAFRYGSVGINSWGGQSFGFGCATWGAYPGESISDVASGIGVVRNYLFLRGVEKTVVRAPFVSAGHIGTAPQPPDLSMARELCAIFSNNVHTTQHNEANGYLQGNFRPVAQEIVATDLEVEGSLPADLAGCYLRNGVNQRFPPMGRMHMFDGDAMLHAFMLADGRCTSYANTWIRTPRHCANEAAGRDLYAPFGDLTVAGLPVAKKFAYQALLQRSGRVPALAPNKAQNPSTATQLIGGALYACVEVNCPFRIWVDPTTGVVSSGEHDDFGGQIPVFSAHSRVDPDGVVNYFAKGYRGGSTEQLALNSYGRIGPDGKVMNRTQFLAGEGAPPAFLHDMFVTASHSICVDHTLRADATKMVTTGYFEFDRSRNVRLGVLPRDASGQMQPDWYDLGLPGFVWHCVGAQEEGDRVTCWMPIFEDYSSEVPIHLAHEPESYLYSACAQEDSTSLCTPFYTALSLFMCTQ